MDAADAEAEQNNRGVPVVRLYHPSVPVPQWIDVAGDRHADMM